MKVIQVTRLAVTLGLTFAVSVQSSKTAAFAISAKGLLKTYGQPVHESITHKAAIDSGLLTDQNQNEIKHLIEGVRFNDDPEGYLIKGTEANKNSTGILGFLGEFVGSHKDKNDATKASHFGDYQFLHAMGKADAKPEEIKQRILLYMYHCWRMGSDPNSFEKLKKDYELVMEQEKNKNPDFHYSRDQIIVRRAALLFPKEILFFHANNQIEFQYRAIGSMLHIVQDSYSRGHVVRSGWEQGDNSGKIMYFQDYAAQDSHEHSTTDKLENGKVNEDSMFKVKGVDNAYKRSRQILEMMANQCPWTSDDSLLSWDSNCDQSLYSLLNEEIFAFDESSRDRSTHSHPEMLPKPKEDNNNFGD